MDNKLVIIKKEKGKGKGKREKEKNKKFKSKNKIMIETETETETETIINTETETIKNTKNVTTIHSIKENYLSWILILSTVSIISYPKISYGLSTFFISFIVAYYLHKESHKECNFFNIIHHYHHKHNNFFTEIHTMEFIVLIVPVFKK